MPDLRPLAAEVDAVVGERVLVHGSSPQRASDLDLLVRPAARAALDRWLPAAGFRCVPAGWLRLVGGQAAVVDLTDAADWRLPQAELDDLFADAEPCEGLVHVVQPGPVQSLLVLARRLQDAGGQLEHRRLARGRRALQRDPDALLAARGRAAAWGCAGAVELLAADLEARPLTGDERRALLERDGVRALPVWRAGLALPRRRSERGVVISLSGIDGAGKSTVARAVHDALQSVDAAPVVPWHRISYGRALHVLATPARLARAVVQRGAAGTTPSQPDPSAAPPAQGPPAAVAPLAAPPASGASRLWPVVVTVVHVLTAGPVTRWHLRRGRTVLRDRDLLDALVHQRYRYGAAAPARLHRALLVHGLPRADVALLLDVPPEVAHRRKPEQFDLAQLTAQRALYLEHAGELGVRRLDATRPPEVLQQEAVLLVLDALEHRRR